MLQISVLTKCFLIDFEKCFHRARGQCHEKVKKIESQYHDIDIHYQATKLKFDPIHSEVTELRMVKTQYMQQVQIYICLLYTSDAADE